MTLAMTQNYGSHIRPPVAFAPSNAKLQNSRSMHNWFSCAVANAALHLAPISMFAAVSLPPQPIPQIALARPAVQSRVETAKNMAEFIVNTQGFPITALSDVLNVERKTIYDWLKKGAEAGPENANRLQRLLEVFSNEETGSLRLFHRFWKRTLPNGQSLYRTLMTPELDSTAIQIALDQLRPAVNTAMAITKVRGSAPHAAEFLSEYVEVGVR